MISEESNSHRWEPSEEMESSTRTTPKMLQRQITMIGKNVLSAAHHEAGHAVVSHKLGCIINEIEIHFEDSRNRWEGTYRHRLANEAAIFQIPQLLQKGAQVAVAGVLAQAKYDVAAEYDEDIHFDDANNLSEWFSFFRDKTRTEENPGSLTILFAFSKDGQRSQHEVDGRQFGGADCQAFNQCIDQVAGISPDDLITEVLVFLDDDDTWSLIDRLAVELSNSEPEDEKGGRRLDLSQANPWGFAWFGGQKNSKTPGNLGRMENIDFLPTSEARRFSSESQDTKTDGSTQAADRTTLGQER